MKKGEITWDTIAKLVLGVILLFVVILLIWFIKDKIYGNEGTLLSTFTRFIKFGA